MARRKKAAPRNARDEAIALASQMIFEFIEKHGAGGWSASGEASNLGSMHELLTLARTRIGAAEDLRVSIEDGVSIGATVALLKYLPEIDEDVYQIIAVDMPGGASASRCTH